MSEKSEMIIIEDDTGQRTDPGAGSGSSSSYTPGALHGIQGLSDSVFSSKEKKKLMEAELWLKIRANKSIQELSLILTQYPELLFCKQKGKTLLMEAASIGNLEIVKFLISQDKTKLKQLLFDRVGSILGDQNIGDNAVSFATYHGHLGVLEFLLSLDNKDQDLLFTTVGDDRESLLHLAVRRGHVHIFRFLVETHVSPLQIASDFPSSQFSLTRVESPLILNTHQTREALLCMITRDGWNLMHTAAYHSRLEILQYLLKRAPALLGKKTVKGESVLMIALSNHKDEGNSVKIDLVREILALDAWQVTGTIGDQKTVFNFIPKKDLDHSKLLQCLTNKMIELFDESNLGRHFKLVLAFEKIQTALKLQLQGLTSVCRAKTLEIHLLKQKLQDTPGTSIIKAEVLSLQKTAPATKDKERTSPDQKPKVDRKALSDDFQDAVFENDFDLAESILADDPDLMYEEEIGFSNLPVIYCLVIDGRFHHAARLLCLDKNQRYLTITDNEGLNIAMLAARFGNLKFLKFLLNSLDKDHILRYSTNIKNDQNLVHIAICKGHLSIVRYLLEECDPHQILLYGTTAMGNSCLELALKKGRNKIAFYLMKHYPGSWSSSREDGDSLSMIMCFYANVEPKVKYFRRLLQLDPLQPFRRDAILHSFFEQNHAFELTEDILEIYRIAFYEMVYLLHYSDDSFYRKQSMQLISAQEKLESSLAKLKFEIHSREAVIHDLETALGGPPPLELAESRAIVPLYSLSHTNGVHPPAQNGNSLSPINVAIKRKEAPSDVDPSDYVHDNGVKTEASEDPSPESSERDVKKRKFS